MYESPQGDRRLVLYLPRQYSAASGALQFRAVINLEYHDVRHERKELEQGPLPIQANDVSITLPRYSEIKMTAKYEAGSPSASAEDLALNSILITAGGPEQRSAANGTRILPSRGAEGELKIRGDFPEATWPVLLCEAPELVCSLKGPGVRRAKGEHLNRFGLTIPGVSPEKCTFSYWEIVDQARLRLNLTHEVCHAPVWARRFEDDGSSVISYEVVVYAESGDIRLYDKFSESEARADGNQLFHVSNPLHAGAELLPESRVGSGDSKGHESIVELNTSQLEINECVDLTIQIHRAGERDERLVHVLRCKCVDVGRIEVSPPKISLAQMYVGEHRSNATGNPLTNPEGYASEAEQRRLRLVPVIPRVEVRNGGQARISITPRAEGGEGWLRVGWDEVEWAGRRRTTAENPNTLTLDAGERSYLLIELDFRTAQPSARSLDARIVLEDTEGSEAVELRDLVIEINTVENRRVAESPLFLDFGNSNCFATVRINDEAGPVVIRAAHSHVTLEPFPSVLLLRQADQANPTKSECYIGPFAVREDRDNRGPDNAPRLIAGVKQSLCRLPGERFVSRVSCVDLSQNRLWLTAEEQLTLFLREMVRRAELIWRGRRITKLVISYPSRLAPGQRRAYFAAFQQACRTISRDSDRAETPLVLEEDVRIDEANAVAIGFLYTNNRELRELIEKELQRKTSLGEDRSIRVVALDLGGGSLDIAVMRFIGRSRITRLWKWSAVYEWIGGDTRFGGNNLTAAAAELLRERICKLAFNDSAIARPAQSSASNRETTRPPSHPLSMFDFAAAMDEVPSPDDFFHGRSENRAAPFHSFWEAAELVKLHALEASQGNSPSRDETRLGRLLAAMLRLNADQTRAIVSGMSLPPLDSLWPTLREIETHTVLRDQHGQGHYSMVDRLEEILGELTKALRTAFRTVDFVVIGGGASRWPTLRERLRIEFSPERIVFEPSQLKSLVAEGLALAWPVLSADGGVGIACSGNCTTAVLGLVPFDDPATSFPFLEICQPLNRRKSIEGETTASNQANAQSSDARQGDVDWGHADWRELRLLDEPEHPSTEVLSEFLFVPAGSSSDELWNLPIYRLFSNSHSEEIGRFVALRSSPPPPRASWTRVEYAFGRDEDELRLRITTSAGEWFTDLHPKSSESSVAAP